MTLPRLLLTPGEPAGIGPDVCIQIAQLKWPAEIIVVTDPAILISRAAQLQLPLTLIETSLDAPRTTHIPGTLKVIPISRDPAPVIAGTLNVLHAPHVIETLTYAANACLAKQADALVTGPVHKGIINQANIAFSGHTEFFAELCRVKQTVMLFVIDQLKVAIATTHIPLSKVPSAITPDLLRAVLQTLKDGLTQYFHLPKPHIAVCGLNPHAGENGYLGREEIDTIEPTLNSLREIGYLLNGPLSADTAFTAKNLAQTNAVLAMYHDQALPLVKYIGFGHAVNMTLGLPFLRTSVDHGTALTLAGRGDADAGSLIAAIELALRCLANPP